MTSEYRVGIFNPLPLTLFHYQIELEETLAIAGRVDTVRLLAPSAEIGDSGILARVRRSMEFIPASRGAAMASCDIVLNIWPTFGLLDPMIWRGPFSPKCVATIFHDPRPLRRQFGYGTAAGSIGSYGLGPSRTTIVHSQEAAHILGAHGWPGARLVGHPVRMQTIPDFPRADPRYVLVAGQYKEARDLELLKLVGAKLSHLGLGGIVAGRGWPEIAGWASRPGFLPEPKLNALIGGASCVLVPYREFFATNIGMRAAELGVPLVAIKNSHTVKIWGGDWPGLVEADARGPAWLAAIARAASIPHRVTADRFGKYRTVVRDDWARLLEELIPAYHHPN